MKILLAVATFGGMCAFVISAPACDQKAVNQGMIDCFSKNGIELDKAMKIVPGVGKFADVGEDFYKDVCAKQDSYSKAMECMTSEYSRCSGPDVYILNSVHMMKMMCADPDFNFSCIVEINKKNLDIAMCVASKFNFETELKTKTMQQVTCESMDAGIKCFVDMLAKCDTHTAEQVDKIQRSSMPKEC